MQTTGSLDLDICQSREIVAKVRGSEAYAQNLYAAMCNQEWQYQDVWTLLQDKRWSCTWRYAGGVVADIRGEGDYMDWYCSGMGAWNLNGDLEQGYVGEGVVTSEIKWDLGQIGWQPIDQ